MKLHAMCRLPDSCTLTILSTHKNNKNGFSSTENGGMHYKTMQGMVLDAGSFPAQPIGLQTLLTPVESPQNSRSNLNNYITNSRNTLHDGVVVPFKVL